MAEPTGSRGSSPIPPDLQTLARTIRAVARAEVLPRFGRARGEAKADGSLVTIADRACQEALRDALRETWPHHAFLGEEMPADEQRRLFERAGASLWLVDPLDGTSNFAAGIPFFAVSAALMVERETVLGVVYDPCQDEWFGAARGAGAWHDGGLLPAAPPAPALHRAMAAVDFKRLPPGMAARLAAHPPYASQRYLGSGALEWCWVAAGRFHVYLHGRQHLWDYAAGELVLREAGGHSCTLDGDPVARGDRQPRSAIAALDRGLYDAWRSWLLASP